MSHRNAAFPDGGLKIYGVGLFFAAVLVGVFALSYSFAHPANPKPMVPPAEPDVLSAAVGSDASDGAAEIPPSHAVVTGVTEEAEMPMTSASAPCVHPILNLREQKYQDICAAQDPVITGEDCDRFLELSWQTSNEAVHPDFKMPANCLTE